MHIKVKKRIEGAPWAKVGSRIPGRLISIQKRLVPFDGRLPHMVFPFTGSRVSIVWFAGAALPAVFG